MADYFTNFSVVLPLTKEQQEYAIQIIEQAKAHSFDNHPLPSDFPADLTEITEDWVFDAEKQENGLWLHSENGGQETAAALIQHLLQKFDFAPSVGFEWSHDCSKPRTDAFGGGAAYITATEIETLTTAGWLQKM